MPGEPAEELFGRYFDAWRRHDTQLLREIFTADATYYIRDKRTLTGIEEIVAYWERNRLRQHDLTVFPPVPCREFGVPDSCVFCVRFFDAEEQQHQIVYGIIRLLYREGRIARLEETYSRAGFVD